MQKLIVRRPVVTPRQTQKFGEAKACIKVNVNGQPAWPQKIVGKRGGLCPAGHKDLYTWYLGMKGHSGEDWATYHGEPLYFSADFGCDWYAKQEPDMGVRLDVYSLERVEIKNPPKSPEALKEWKANGGRMYVKFVHAHLKDILWANEDAGKGKLVKYGWQIGWCDNTGMSSGDHLHWSMKFVDKNGKTLDKDNGYMGAVDFREHATFVNEFVGDHVKIKRVQAELHTLQEKLAALLKRYVALLQAKLYKASYGTT